tara:strand:- start:56 stop:199 length:144 start_codon:yes stop_codon:yes gene_type:complete
VGDLQLFQLQLPELQRQDLVVADQEILTEEEMVLTLFQVVADQELLL